MRMVGLLLCCLLAASQARAAEVAAADFTPVLRPAPDQTSVHVSAFNMDADPVTNGQCIEFVRHHPQWRRDRIPSTFADEGYLSHWRAADELGSEVHPDQPVTRVSWYAARAYCRAGGGRLPEWNQWELAAAADERVRDARSDTAWRSRILDWYARPATDPLERVGQHPPNLYGIHDLHGLIWEWVDDAGSLMVSSDSRKQGDPDKLEFCGAGSISAQDREDYPVLMRIAFLSALEARSTARRLGFRCVRGPDTSEPDEATASAGTPSDSLYQLPISLESADGRMVPLASFAGSPLVVTMFFGRCNGICPMLTHNLQAFERHMAAGSRAATRFLMVTFDSVNDTPEALSAYRREHHIDSARWTVARTSPENVRLLAAALGIRYRQLPDGSFNHSTVVTLADGRGVIRARSSGVQWSDTELVTAANAMLLRQTR